MTTDDAQPVGAAFQELRGGEADIRMGQAMEPIAAHALLFVILVRQAVEMGVGRHRVVKRRVEHRHVRSVRKHPPRLADAGDVDRIVQRRERTQFLETRQHFVRDQRGLGEALPAMHHAMAHDAHLRHRADHARPRIGQRAEQGIERFGVARRRQFPVVSPFGPRWTWRVPLVPMRSIMPLA